ncbi:MAG TPA: carboxypeptidase-like regulatory domain-containing protein, partial [Phaeodactylibacter sp.]|nr:carboxypeptidase-like regulatory domain-containing protein [Phaeodactylibacter sp.]
MKNRFLSVVLWRRALAKSAFSILFFTALLSVSPFGQPALMAQGVITGQITDAEGEPLPGAYIKVLQTGQVATANETGLYRVEGLEPGTYDLRFSFVGFKPELRTTRVKEGTAKTIMHVQLKEEVIQLKGLEVRANRVELLGTATTTVLRQKELMAADDARD